MAQSTQLPLFTNLELSFLKSLCEDYLTAKNSELVNLEKRPDTDGLRDYFAKQKSEAITNVTALIKKLEEQIQPAQKQDKWIKERDTQSFPE